MRIHLWTYAHRGASTVGNLLAIGLLFGSLTSASAVDKSWTAKYAEHLPEWCKYTKELPEENINALYGDPKGTPYQDMFGDDFQNLHHYCRGVFDIYKGSTATGDKALRELSYESAVREFDYLIDRTAEHCSLAPDIHYQRGVALMNLGRSYDAIRSFTNALQLRPDFVQVYLALSEYFERVGEPQEAERIIREGLTHDPSASALKERLAKLEGSASDRPVAQDTSR